MENKKLTCCLFFLIVFFFFINSCIPKKQIEEKKDPVASLEEGGFGLVPFYEGGRLGFLGKNALRSMNSRELQQKEALLLKNQEFEVAAKEMFKNNTNIYWVGPDEYKNLYAALSGFPKDAYGYPDWVAAAKTGYILPLNSLYGEENQEEGVFNLDIIFQINDKMMANVRFPHSVHNYWLSCQVCHPAIFIPKKGANKFGMNDIWAGKFCGKCHGRVAYAPKGFLNCIRCHSVTRDTIKF